MHPVTLDHLDGLLDCVCVQEEVTLEWLVSIKGDLLLLLEATGRKRGFCDIEFVQ